MAKKTTTSGNKKTNNRIPLSWWKQQRQWVLTSSTVIGVLSLVMASLITIPAEEEGEIAEKVVFPPPYARGSNSNNPAWALDDFETRQLMVPTTDENGATTKNFRPLTIDKLSSNPPILRVKNFLTPAECATLRRLAVEQELLEGYVDSDQDLGSNNNKKKKMLILDHNNDGRLSILELLRMVDDFFESHLLPQDIRTMLSTALPNLLLEDDETVSIQDFVQSDTSAMRRYLSNLMRTTPSKRSRHSKMAWINSSNNNRSKEDRQVLESIRQRVALLTNLPDHIIHDSMELQVVHYENGRQEGTHNGGRYTAHFDSLPLSKDLPCCHIVHRKPPCRTCRMATVLYNLSNDGGSTAFPLAVVNQDTTTTTMAEQVEEWRSSAASRDINYCAKGEPGLRLPPQLGQAILWYNHKMDHLMMTNNNNDDDVETPLLGPLDRSSLHAGCPFIQKGASSSEEEEVKMHMNTPGKWIANHWIEASNVAGEDKEHFRRMQKQIM